jgi:uncharacterized phiE125 gp8 family phage protein
MFIMTLTLLSPPAAEPLTLSELKDHLRVSDANEDALITSLLAAAVRSVEARGRLALMPQQWRLTLDRAPAETVILPLAPVTAVDVVTVIDAQGAAQTVAANLYETALGSPGRLRPAGPWPQPGPRLAGVMVDFTAGYATAGAVPDALKQAVKLLAAYFYETREAVGDTRIYGAPQSVDALIAPYREPKL